MNKRIQISTIASIAGMIVACNNSNTSPIKLENNIPITINSIASKDIDTTIITKQMKKKLDKPSYTIDIELPLYKFTNEELYKQIKDIAKGNCDAFAITYLPTTDIVKRDTLQWHYNLLISPIIYKYHGNSYDNIAHEVVGCCMIDTIFCYIYDKTTLKRLFTHTGKKEKHTVQSWSEICLCQEIEEYCYLYDNDSLVYFPVWEL
jgi:hypothetical protein